MYAESDSAIVADDTKITLPSNTFQLIEARFINGTYSHAIVIRPKKWLVSRYPNIASLSTNIPVYGYVEGDYLYLYPLSNGSYSIRKTVVVDPTFSDADGTENPIPHLDRALVCYGIAAAMRSLQMFEGALQWDSEYSKAFLIAVTGDKKKPFELQMQPFGSKTPAALIEPYLDPFAGHY